MTDKLPFKYLDSKYLRDVSKNCSDRCLEVLAIELGIEADSETVSFMRQTFMQTSVDVSRANHESMLEYRLKSATENNP